jgi:hypothetical protein
MQAARLDDRERARTHACMQRAPLVANFRVRTSAREQGRRAGKAAQAQVVGAPGEDARGLRAAGVLRVGLPSTPGPKRQQLFSVYHLPLAPRKSSTDRRRPSDGDETCKGTREGWPPQKFGPPPRSRHRHTAVCAPAARSPRAPPRAAAPSQTWRRLSRPHVRAAPLHPPPAAARLSAPLEPSPHAPAAPSTTPSRCAVSSVLCARCHAARPPRSVRCGG